jgi:hypothetical protein
MKEKIVITKTQTTLHYSKEDGSKVKRIINTDDFLETLRFSTDYERPVPFGVVSINGKNGKIGYKFQIDIEPSTYPTSYQNEFYKIKLPTIRAFVN